MFRRFAHAVGLVGLVALVGAVVPAGAASAHDQLLASSPTEGQQFGASPTGVSLTFDNDVLALGAVVVVVDEAGKNWVAGEAKLDGTTVTAELTGALPDAGYQVRWRVVSGDGHPITGIIPFTVGDAAPFSAAASATGTEVQTSSTAPPGKAADSSMGPDQTSTGRLDFVRVATVGAVGAAAALLTLGAFTFFSRRRKRGGVDAEPR